LRSGFEYAELGELALSLLVESSAVLAQPFTPEVSVLLLRALLAHVSAPTLATPIFAPALLNELRIAGEVFPLLGLGPYL